MSDFDKTLEKGIEDIQFLTVNYVMRTLRMHRVELIEFLHPNLDGKDYDRLTGQALKKDSGQIWNDLSSTDRKKTIAFAVKLYEEGPHNDTWVWVDGKIKVER